MKAIVIGGTGLIGKLVVEELKANSQVTEVVVLTRNTQATDGKVKFLAIDFNQLNSLEINTGFDVAFCCLGTTIKKAKTKANFELVDYTYVVNFAQWAKNHHIKTLGVISAMGANPNSSVFYSKVKGKTEQALKNIGFYGLLFYRPSLLLGQRNEFRLGEKLGEIMLKIFQPILIGQWQNYRAIQAADVAKTMVNTTLKQPKGIRIFSSGEIKSYLKAL